MTDIIYDLFISYSSRDTAHAQHIQKTAEQFGLRVFLSSEEIATGVRWPEKVIAALSASWEVCVLFTRDSISREWVISEWSVALFMNKVVTPVLKDIDIAAIPERLRIFQAADFYKTDLFLKDLITRRDENLSTYSEFVECCRLKRHDTIQEALLSLDTSGSPFRFVNCLKLASDAVFFTGQNYYWPLVTNERSCHHAVFSFLEERHDREVRVMLCDYTFSHGVTTWCKVNGEAYREHLAQATINLAHWQEEAEQRNLGLVAKVVPFVPVSVSFMDYRDPESKQASLFLTPNAFESRSGRRPSIRFSRSRHREVYDNYYEPYNTWFSQGRDIRNVDVR